MRVWNSLFQWKEMRRSLKSVGKLAGFAIGESFRHNTPQMAAALAFYTLLSLAPALWLILAIAGTIFGRSSARTELISFVTNMAGAQTAGVVQQVMSRIEADKSVATILGLISLFLGAGVAFGALQDNLNTIWHAPPRKRGMILSFLIQRLISFAIVGLLGLVLLLSVLIGTVIGAVSKFLPQFLPAPEFILQTIHFLVSFGLITAVLAAIYKILPDVPIAWSDVWVGAAVTAGLSELGKTGIELYLGHSSTSSAYGTAGSLVVFLLWVYYSAQIFLFGAEFTHVYTHRAAHLAAPKHAEDKPVESEITQLNLSAAEKPTAIKEPS
jgi:membrane protein